MEEFKLDLTEKVAHIEESVKSAHKRIDSIDALTKSVYELASNIKSLQHDVTDVSDRIKVIEGRPAKRWDLIVTTVITALVSAAATYFIAM